MRPIQIGVPDVRASSFRAEAHRQFLAVAGSAHAAEDQAFIDTVSDVPGPRGVARNRPERPMMGSAATVERSERWVTVCSGHMGDASLAG